jgi:hypothetical protein
MTMARVFVLGAGASKAITDNAPLNHELLPGIFEMYRSVPIVGWDGEYNPELVENLLDFVRDFYF